MNQQTILLKELRRAIERYQAQKRELQSCDWRMWDAKITAFNQFLQDTPVVGDQIKQLMMQATGDSLSKLFSKDGAGQPGEYDPPADETERLAYIAQFTLGMNAIQIAKRGSAIKRGQATHNFDYMRSHVINELLDRVEEKLRWKLEDLEGKYRDGEAPIPFSQTFIFSTTAIVHTGPGDINVDMRSFSALGVGALLRRLDDLERVLREMAAEQARAAVAAEADDLMLHKKLGEIRAAVKAGQVQVAAGLWEQFTKEVSVSRLSSAAGQVVDVVTLAFWVWHLSQGKTPGIGQ